MGSTHSGCPNWGRVWGPNMGSRFGTQFWGPNLGPPSHAFSVAGLRATACNSPNSYALPRGGCAGCGRDICLMDQSNRSNIFSTVFCDVNLAAATVEGLRAEARKSLVFPTRKVGPQFQLRLHCLGKRTRLVPPCCVARQQREGPRSL